LYSLEIVQTCHCAIQDGGVSVERIAVGTVYSRLSPGEVTSNNPLDFAGLETLTPRERDRSLALAADGQSNKQIARTIGIGDRQVMRKMRARSLAELIRIAEMLKNNGIDV
jgi:DNA-binding NarL/FixJ family response regulator